MYIVRACDPEGLRRRFYAEDREVLAGLATQHKSQVLIWTKKDFAQFGVHAEAIYQSGK